MQPHRALCHHTVKAAHRAMRKFTQKRPNWGHVGQVSLTGLVHTMGQRGTGEQGGHALAHPSSSQTQTGVSPLPRKQARHISQALTSVTREETSYPDSNLQMTTETKHEPEST